MNRIIKVILATTTIMFSVSASSGLNDAFSDAFSDITVQSGGGGTYELNGRTLHSAGYVRIRIPVVASPNPVRFQAPGIKGGCNGFDIYGGSFSYISEDEILDWLNAVIENSGALVTYMFITYLQEQCSVCSEVMQTLYAMQDMLNMTMQDSCTTATAMVDGLQGALDDKESPAWDSYTQGIKDSTKNFSQQMEDTYDDAVDVMKKLQGSVVEVAQAAVPDATKRNKEFYGGNMLYWVVEETEALEQFKVLLGNSSLTKAQLFTYLVAIVGNQVDFIDETDITQTKATNIGTYKSNVTLNDFISASFKENTVPSDCGTWPDADFCRDPADKVVKNGFADVKPFIDTFKCVMEGENSAGASCGSGVGIIGKLGKMKDDVGELTTEESDFITNFLPGFNFGGMLVGLSSSPAAMSQFYECTGEMLMNGYAYHQMTQAIEIVQKNLRGVNFGTDKGADRESAYLGVLKKRRDTLSNDYAESNKNIKGKSNCNRDAIKAFLDFEKYTKSGNK